MVHLSYTKTETLTFTCIVKILRRQLRKTLAPVTYHVAAKLYSALKYLLLVGVLGKYLPAY